MYTGSVLGQKQKRSTEVQKSKKSSKEEKAEPLEATVQSFNDRSRNSLSSIEERSRPSKVR
jgi:hypothetical protein